LQDLQGRRVTTMGWLDLSEYKQIDNEARARVADLLSSVRPRRPRKAAAARRSSLATLLYVASRLRAKPRMIDGYIDYFGEPVLN
jgi:hypothetical protein